MSIGTRRLYELVGFWTKFRQQKAFLGTCFHPEAEGNEHRTQQRPRGCLSGCGCQQRNDQACVNRVTHEAIGAGGN